MTREASDELEPEEPEEPEELALGEAVAAGAAVATAPTPPVTGPLSWMVASLPPMALAAVWYLSKVLPDEGALIDPTIPIPQ